MYTQWLGLCHGCGSWNSIIKICDKGPHIDPLTDTNVSQVGKLKIKPPKNFFTGDSDFDTVLMGTIYKGALSMFVGEPGVGKTTFLINLIKMIADNNIGHFLYSSTEETVSQLSQRFFNDNKSEVIFLCNEVDVNRIFKIIQRTNINLVILDSIQLITDEENETNFDSVSGSRSIIHKINQFAKTYGVTFLFAGQVIKSGEIAGAKHIQHMVDTVFELSFVKGMDNLTSLSCKKNRFSPNRKCTLLEYDQSTYTVCHKLLINSKDIAKTSIGVARGFYEDLGKFYFYNVESLLVRSSTSLPKRVLRNINRSKVDMLLAVLTNSLSLDFSEYDIYLNVSPNHSNVNNSQDLAICASILSSIIKKSNNKFFHGEIRFSGEVLPHSCQFDKYHEELIRIDFHHVSNYPSNRLDNFAHTNIANIEELYVLFK